MTTAQIVGEFKEFSGFSPYAQNYIMSILSFAHEARERSRKLGSKHSIAISSDLVHLERLNFVSEHIPHDPHTHGAEGTGFMEQLIAASNYDLSQNPNPKAGLDTFNAYRFLYERVVGPRVRPWLPSAFCAAAAAPNLRSERRKALLLTIGEASATAPGWRQHPPAFFPMACSLE